MRRFWVPLLLASLSVVSVVKAEINMTNDNTVNSNLANSKSNSVHQWEIKAPAGSEMDLKEDKLLYFGTAESPVTLTSAANSFKLTALQVVYYRGREMFFAQGEVVIDGEDPGSPSQRFVVTGEEVIYLVDRGELELPQGGTVQNPQGDTLRASRILIFLDTHSSVQEIKSFEASGGFELSGVKGRLTGDALRGDNRQGFMEATGDIYFQYSELSGTAEKAVYSEDHKEVHLLGEPLLYQGEDYITGEKIIYHLDTEQVKVIGPVKARLCR